MRPAALLLALALPLAGQDGRAGNAIDDRMADVWRAAGVEPAERADDFEFLRRVTLDVAGRTPTVEEVRAWRANPAPDRRARKVDELIASPAFLDHWSRRLASATAGYRASNGFTTWMRARLEAGDGWDAIAAAMVATRGERSRPELAFLEQFRDADEAASGTARTFLGLRLHCARCHDHPTDRWTMRDFQGLAAFFDGAVPVNGRGSMVLRESLQPVFPDARGPSPRGALPRLLTSHDQFARAFVNRVWAYFFGRGIVHPYDDFHPRQRAPAARVLDLLAREFRVMKFDLRWLVRSIATLRAYDCTSRGPAHDESRDVFARARVRPLAPHQHWTAIVHATQLDRVTFDDLVLAAAGIVRGSREENWERMRRWFTDVLTRDAPRETPEGLVTHDAHTQTALRLMSRRAPVWMAVPAASGGRLSTLLRSRAGEDAAVDELFAASLGRGPTDRERAIFARAWRRGPDALEDAFWALLNTDEFIFNH